MPTSYYMSETLDDEPMKTAVIANGRSLKLDFQVTRNDSVLRYSARRSYKNTSLNVILYWILVIIAHIRSYV